jgi:uncharacterized repeat protein (TIGR02543 family)
MGGIIIKKIGLINKYLVFVIILLFVGTFITMGVIGFDHGVNIAQSSNNDLSFNKYFNPLSNNFNFLNYQGCETFISFIDSVREATPMLILASGNGITNLDNVSLWYRYSPDNYTWTEWNNAGNGIWPPEEIHEGEPYWKFQFDEGLGYYEFYTIGELNGYFEGPKNQSEAMSHHIGTTHTVIDNPNPINESVNLSTEFFWQVSIFDPKGRSFDWSIECSNGQNNSGMNEYNGTKHLFLSGLHFQSTYTIWVNVTYCGFFARRSDVNRDGIVGPTDFLLMQYSYGLTGEPGWIPEDVNCDGVVNYLDLSAMASNYGQVTNGEQTWTNDTFTFSTKQNLPPVLSNPTPMNNSYNQDSSLLFSVDINDPEGDSFNWTIECSNGQVSGGTDDMNGTKTLELTGLEYSTMYIVWVNATDSDGSGLYTRKWYTFTTENPVEYVLSVSVEPQDSGYVTVNPVPPYYNGTMVTLTAYENPGYTFNNWTGDLSGSANPKTLVMDDDKNVTATFSKNEYNISISIVGNGIVNKDPDQETYHYDDLVELTAIADSGWSFSHWSGDINGSINPTTILIQDSIDITAHFIYTNTPPYPPFINGPSSGKIGIPQSYTFVAIDPQGDDISYQIDWGDGTITPWSEYFPSNEVFIQTHIWNEIGSYTIKARGKDIHGDIGEWGIMVVSMPLSSNSQLQQFLASLLQRSPKLN